MVAAQLVGMDDRKNGRDAGQPVQRAHGVSARLAARRGVGRPHLDHLLTLIRTAPSSRLVLEDAFFTSVRSSRRSWPILKSTWARSCRSWWRVCATRGVPAVLISVGLIGDICRALGESSAKYCDVLYERAVCESAVAAAHTAVSSRRSCRALATLPWRLGRRLKSTSRWACRCCSRRR